MKTLTKLMLATTLCVLSAHAEDSDNFYTEHPTIGRSFFEPRSQLANLGRNFAGLAHLIFLDTCDFNCQFNIVPEFSGSSRETKIGTYLFFTGGRDMLFSSTADPQTQVFTQNFLLNDDFKGIAQVAPKVSNALATFDLYLGLDNVTRGLFFRVLAQGGKTTWNAKLDDEDTYSGTFISANALGNTANTPSPYNSIVAAWNGDLTFFDVKQPLHYARLDGSKSHSGLTNIECILGYNVVRSDCYYFGFNIGAIIPTGNTPKATYLFEPVLGNGNHFELGGGVTWHRQLWTDGCKRRLDFYIQGNVYHIFNATQHRTFDLLGNGIGSRYLLFKKFNSDGTYAGEIIRGPNILTLKVHVKNTIEGQAMFMLDYQHGGFTVDFGYNLWGRSNDRITLLEEIPVRTYGIAGVTGTGPGANETASLTTISGANANIPDPVNQYISTLDLNIRSGEHPGCFSHSFFGHLGYVWETTTVSPFIGFGAQAEFPDKTDTALKLFHAWGKFGVAF